MSANPSDLPLFPEANPRRGIQILIGLLAAVLLACACWICMVSPPLSAVPRPYPGAVVTTDEHWVGNWGTMREESYRVNRSLTDIEQYYKEQMPAYCRKPVEFAEKSQVQNTWPCRESETVCYVASCKIPSSRDMGPWAAPLHGQWFVVQLYPVNESTTEVVQITSWTD
jgi:hypothetical protein